MSMRKKTATAALMMMLLFSACFDDGGGSGRKPVSGEKLITISRSGTNYVYFSLKNGTEVDSGKSNTTEWDLQIPAGTRILTNSGTTAAALGSGGTGGSVFLNTTDFSVDVDTSTLTVTPDWGAYTSGMGAPSLGNFSVMSFPGYASGDGSVGNPYATVNWSAHEFFWYPAMPPVFTMTDRVYAVKFGDGSGYSKLQILSTEYDTDNYYILIKYEEIED